MFFGVFFPLPVLFVLFHFFLSLIYKLIVFIETAVKFGPYGTENYVRIPYFSFSPPVFSLTIICVSYDFVKRLGNPSTLNCPSFATRYTCHPLYHPLCTRQSPPPLSHGLTASDEFAISRLLVVPSSRARPSL